MNNPRILLKHTPFNITDVMSQKAVTEALFDEKLEDITYTPIGYVDGVYNSGSSITKRTGVSIYMYTLLPNTKYKVERNATTYSLMSVTAGIVADTSDVVVGGKFISNLKWEDKEDVTPVIIDASPEERVLCTLWMSETPAVRVFQVNTVTKDDVHISELSEAVCYTEKDITGACESILTGASYSQGKIIENENTAFEAHLYVLKENVDYKINIKSSEGNTRVCYVDTDTLDFNIDAVLALSFSGEETTIKKKEGVNAVVVCTKPGREYYNIYEIGSALEPKKLGLVGKIICPDIFYAVVGHELNIYYDTIVCGMDDGLNSPFGLYVDISTTDFNGLYSVRHDRFWQLKGLTASHVGEKNLRIRVYDKKSGLLLDSKQCTLVVTSNEGLSSATNILCIGDSLTAAGVITQTCHDDFESLGGTTPTFIGTQGSNPYQHEGRSGWYITGFTSGGPFYNKTTASVDFGMYRENVGLDNPLDAVVIMAGTNDVLVSNGNPINAIFSFMSLASKILEDSPDCKIIIQLVPQDANTTSSWHVYSDSASIANKYRHFIGVWNLRYKLYEEFSKERWKGSVYIGQAPTGLDRYYGFPYTSGQMSSRIEVQEVQHGNCVHPNNAGYQQLGDGYFLQLRALLG